ncbi:MAG: NAD(P)/FAD-dependent oxidoreductase [Acidobacteriota bacterium]|nr:NAD(P)/FAD-dependent oxidoreductase [Acidobacteriota bacterium]
MREVIIIGGGPAGAVCAERLARAHSTVTVIDDHLAWEKPCGGGLTQKAIRAYPFLLDGPYPKKIIREIELRAGPTTTARLTVEEPIVIYSRQVLNGLLLDRAEHAGARILRARAVALNTTRARPQVTLAGGEKLESDFVVLATGARNRLLPATATSDSLDPLEPADLEQTLGYYIPADSDILKIKFVPNFRGYLWSFPRPGHLSVGICGKLDHHSTATLRAHLEQYVDEERLPREGATVFSHLLPSPRPATVRDRPVLGPAWALVGDAAATVDSLTGEGIFYALRSGELLGECLAANQPEEYPNRLRTEFSAELERAAQLAPRFYSENFMGGAVTTRTVEFARRSPTFRRRLAAIFTGTQDYRTLPLRLWAQLPLSLAEIGWHFLVD